MMDTTSSVDERDAQVQHTLAAISVFEEEFDLEFSEGLKVLMLDMGTTPAACFMMGFRTTGKKKGTRKTTFKWKVEPAAFAAEMGMQAASSPLSEEQKEVMMALCSDPEQGRGFLTIFYAVRNAFLHANGIPTDEKPEFLN